VITPNAQAYTDAADVASMLRVGLSLMRTPKGRPWSSADLWRAVRTEDGPSRVTVWQWVEGRAHIPTDWLLRCADALGWDALLRLRAVELQAKREAVTGARRRAAQRAAHARRSVA
jgi:hypothetical protein